MREEGDQKGGGLAIMYREKEDFKWNRIENGIKDVLEVEGRIGELEVRVILNYFRTGSGEEVNINNNRVKDFIVGRIEELGQNIGIIVLGDFNGHLGYLGDQMENSTGKLVNEMLEKGNLNLFNLDDRCRGVYTWQRGTSRSVIDLVLVNEKMLGRMIGMEIDEERERIDISDHALIEIKIKGGRVEKENRKK